MTEYKILKWRGGLENDLVVGSLLAREGYICTDTGRIAVCYSPGLVRWFVSLEEIQELLNSSPTLYQALIDCVEYLEGEGTILAGILADIDDLQLDVGNLKTKVGTATLATTEQDLSGAVNELDSEIGVLSSLTTAIKTSIVNAINELVAKIGTLTSLTTTAKTSLVGAVNELNANVGIWRRVDTLSSALQITSTDSANPTLIPMSENYLSGKIYAIELRTGSGDIRNSQFVFFQGTSASTGYLLFSGLSGGTGTVARTLKSSQLGLYNPTQAVYVGSLYRIN